VRSIFTLEQWEALMDPALILAALLFWNPAQGARGTTSYETLQAWSNAIAAACEGPRQCLMLGALASEETHFAPWVLDGSCQSAEWRQKHKVYTVCDSGEGYGPWQIHRQAWAAAEKELSLPDDLIIPSDHAWVAAKILRTRPLAWSTYKQAKADVDKWLMLHP
jgi:hypothetical protein